LALGAATETETELKHEGGNSISAGSGNALSYSGGEIPAVRGDSPVMKIPPLQALAAIVIVGVTLEAVERKSRPAAYALLIVILLGVITFNADTFKRETEAIWAVLSQKPAPKVRSGRSGSHSGSKVGR
jgi:hypothetical protein